MTFSYNLVLALFLLSPGFSLVAGVYAVGRSSREVAPPPPNSIMALAMVTGGALVAHALTASFFAVGGAIVAGLGCWWTLPHPNPYVLAIGLGHVPASQAGLGVAWILVALSIMCLVTYASTRSFMSSRLARTRTVGANLYGWFWQIEETRGAFAYVLTNFESEDWSTGYWGIMEYVTLDSERQISTIVLAEAEAFTMAVDKKTGDLRRQPSSRPGRKLRVYLTKAEIRNIAFVPVVYDDDPDVEAVEVESVEPPAAKKPASRQKASSPSARTPRRGKASTGKPS